MATFPANCVFPARVVAIDVGGTKITGSIVRYDSAEAEPVVEDSRTVATEAMKHAPPPPLSASEWEPPGASTRSREISPTRTTSCRAGADNRSHRHCMSALAFLPPF